MAPNPHSPKRQRGLANAWIHANQHAAPLVRLAAYPRVGRTHRQVQRPVQLLPETVKIRCMRA